MKVVPKEMEQYKFPVLSALISAFLSLGLIWFLKIVDNSFTIMKEEWMIFLITFGITFVLAMIIQYINNQEMHYFIEESINMFLLLIMSAMVYSFLQDINFIPFTVFAGLYYVRSIIRKGGI